MSVRTYDAPLLAFAHEVGETGTVSVAGARTRWALGGALAPAARVLAAPAGIVAHEPAEMTVRVRAGTAVADLHGALAAARQRTALPERGGTVGGALAAGEDDLRSLGRGKVRAALLEVTYVSAEGRLVRGGAPTVKNVSGFDLPRVMVGALGTLGLLVEVVLRTQPVPESSCWLVSGDAAPHAVLEAAPRASAVLYDGVRTFVELEGYRVDLEEDRRALGALGSFEATDGPPAAPEHRWSLAPGALRHLDTAATGDFLASIGTGLVLAARPRPARHHSDAVRALSSRLKTAFDATGRLNPGRDPLAVAR